MSLCGLHPPWCYRGNRSLAPRRASHYGTDDLPFSAASQIILSQILNEELFGQLAAVQPRVATLQALNTRRATVQISTPDHFEAVLNEALSLPASGGAGLQQRRFAT